MKHRIKKHLSIIIALSMFLSLIPFYGAAVDDEFAGFETLEEIPFEFVLEPGDLPFEQLEDAVLAAEDIPSCIDPALAEARGHVNRLYLQEPDDYTVMFQNRDASKTVYVFSYPVKGSTVSTTASIQINGSVVSFTSGNAITSRISELHDYNIGYCEIQTLANGILSSDGVNITSDARGWARGESNAAELSYNISNEAAAEYAASIATPDTEISTAALVPGTTITPITPSPLTGATVMAISYSTLAGVMSFKSASSTTDKYLTANPSVTNSILVANRIIVPFSQWVVEYNSDFGYTVTNLYQPANKYLGIDENGDFAVTSLDNMLAAFTIDIVSSSDSEARVTISFGATAIDSTASLYSNDPDAASFPTSCEWIIKNKTDCNLVESITPASSVRTVNSGAIFYGEYTTTPTTPTYSDIELYYASNDQIVSSDSDYDLPDSTAYNIASTGYYTVYYKDNCTGITSSDFTIVVYDLKSFTANYTYMIQPVNLPNQYLTMNINTASTSRNELSLSAIAYSQEGYGANSGGPSQSEANLKESWESQSKTFTISAIDNNPGNYSISATLTSSQNDDPTLYKDTSKGEFQGTYERLILADDEITNTINCSITIRNGEESIDLCTKHIDDDYSQMRLWYVDGYYYILCGTNASSELLALQCVGSESTGYSVVVAPLDITETSFRWNITHVGVDVPLIKQTRNYVCGFTTLLQVMMGAGLDVTVDPDWIGTNGDTAVDLDAKMKMIALEVEDLEDEASQRQMVSHVTKLLCNTSNILTGKENVNAVVCQDLEGGNNISDADLAESLLTSMETGFAPFFLTRTPYSPYKYDDSETAHYVAIAGIKHSNDGDDLNDYVILSNCHYNNNVFGVYVVSFADFRNGWLYKYPTDDTPHLYLFDYATGG